MLDPNIVSADHYEVAHGVQKYYRNKRPSGYVAILGIDELSDEESPLPARKNPKDS